MNKNLHLYDSFIFDCDGVIWNRNRLIEGAAKLLSTLIEKGKKVILLTNNSAITRKQFAQKCISLGLPITEVSFYNEYSFTQDNIVCTAHLAAHYLKMYDPNGLTYLIGENGLVEELDSLKLRHFGEGPDPTNLADLYTSCNEKSVTSVLVGFDRHINYAKILKASTYISRGAVFYATNLDAQFPSTDCLVPGTGSIVSSVTVASGKEPIVFGKPDKRAFDFISKKYDIDPNKTIMVGDRLDTDILFGNKNNLTTILVMTGITTDEIFSQIKDPFLKPTIKLESIADIQSLVD